MRNAILLALVTAGLAVCVPAAAQSNTDVKHALSALRPRVKQLRDAVGNLLQMEEAMKGTEEFNVIYQVITAKNDFDSAISEVHTTALILVHMTCPDDTLYVRDALRESARYAAQMGEIDLKTINISLTELTTPAVVVEATKIRDLMIEIRDTVKPLAGKE